MSEPKNPYFTMATNWFQVPPPPPLRWVFKHKPIFKTVEGKTRIYIHPEDVPLLTDDCEVHYDSSPEGAKKSET